MEKPLIFLAVLDPDVPILVFTITNNYVPISEWAIYFIIQYYILVTV